MKDLKTKVYESIGQASMCWEEVPKGLFDEKQANKVATSLLKHIKKTQKSQLLDFAEWMKYYSKGKSGSRCVSEYLDSIS